MANVSPTQPVPEKLRRVLLANIDEALALDLTQRLEPRGYAVATASRALPALELVMSGDFDLVVCDIAASGLPSEKFYWAVAKVRPHLCDRFLFITASGISQSVQSFLDSLNRHTLIRPVSVDAIAFAVTSLVP
jgi:CheY-like chemotaxis protein